jgi:phage shock protein PspC (stress-responsive transcriptional regulator)
MFKGDTCLLLFICSGNEQVVFHILINVSRILTWRVWGGKLGRSLSAFSHQGCDFRSGYAYRQVKVYNYNTEVEMSGKLMRRNDDRMIGGVCGGLGRYLKIDPVLVRLAFVLLTLSGGAGPLVYLLLLILMPLDSDVVESEIVEER